MTLQALARNVFQVRLVLSAPTVPFLVTRVWRRLQTGGTPVSPVWKMRSLTQPHRLVRLLALELGRFMACSTLRSAHSASTPTQHLSRIPQLSIVLDVTMDIPVAAHPLLKQRRFAQRVTGATPRMSRVVPSLSTPAPQATKTQVLQALLGQQWQTLALHASLVATVKVLTILRRLARLDTSAQQRPDLPHSSHAQPAPRALLEPLLLLGAQLVHLVPSVLQALALSALAHQVQLAMTCSWTDTVICAQLVNTLTLSLRLALPVHLITIVHQELSSH